MYYTNTIKRSSSPLLHVVIILATREPIIFIFSQSWGDVAAGAGRLRDRYLAGQVYTTRK